MYSVMDRHFSLSFSNALPLHFFNKDSYRRVYSFHGIETYFPTLSRVINNSQIAAVFSDAGYEHYSFFLRNRSTTAHISFFSRDIETGVEKEAKNYFFEKKIGRHSATFFQINQTVEDLDVQKDSVFTYMRYAYDGNGFGITADRELLKQNDGTIHAIDHGWVYYKNIACDISALEGDTLLRGKLTAKYFFSDFKTTVQPVFWENNADVAAEIWYKGLGFKRDIQYDWIGSNSLIFNEIGYDYHDSVSVYIRHIDIMRHAAISLKDEYLAGVMWKLYVPINDMLGVDLNGDAISDPSFFTVARTSLVYSQSFFSNDLTLTAFIRNNYTADSIYAPDFVTWDAYVEALLISARFFILTENVFHQKYYDFNGFQGDGLRVRFGFSWNFYN